MKEKLTIGLFGFGVVGEGIYKVLTQKPQLNSEIKKIIIKHPDKKREAPDYLFSTDANAVLNDKEINVVVELIDDADAAFDIVKKAMENGKSVVSANKKMIAEHHEELINLQEQNNVSFLYEAAVCGSVPIIRNLEEYFDNDLLHYVSGIVNGSTNYILTKMAAEGESYALALEAAQTNGFAESDPTLDVEGIDAANKLTIITLHAFGRYIKSEDILRKGITSVQIEDFKYASEKGFVIKLIAESVVNEKTAELTATIFPTFIPKNETLSLVNNEYNGVLIGSSLADEQFLYGKGAGRYPTSSAVLSDISALKYDYQYSLRKRDREGKPQSFIGKGKFYIGFGKDIKIDLDFFDSIEEQFIGREYSYIVGEIGYDKLKSNDFWKNKDISIIAFEA